MANMLSHISPLPLATLATRSQNWSLITDLCSALNLDDVMPKYANKAVSPLENSPSTWHFLVSHCSLKHWLNQILQKGIRFANHSQDRSSLVQA